MDRKTLNVWFEEYGRCHQNSVNERIHWVCVPLIFFSLLGLLWELPTPSALAELSPWLNWSTLAMAASLAFYLSLSLPLSVGMLLFFVLSAIGLSAYQSWQPTSLWSASLTIFVAAWIGQFIGHKIEGKKPAFFEDLQFLLIGPLWVLAFAYRKLGLRY